VVRHDGAHAHLATQHDGWLRQQVQRRQRVDVHPQQRVRRLRRPGRRVAVAYKACRRTARLRQRLARGLLRVAGASAAGGEHGTGAAAAGGRLALGAAACAGCTA
jgi:hypothetical protein